MAKTEKKKMNKKGSILDIVFWGMVLLVFAVATLVAFKVYTEFNARIQLQDDIPSTSKAASTQILGFFPGVFDNTFLFLAIGLSIVVFVLAALVRVHPIFIPLFFVAWVFFIFIAGVFSNIYQEMAAQPEFISLANQLNFISTIITYLPILTGIFGIVLMIVMYKQWRVSQFS